MIMKVTPVQVFLLILTFFSVSALVPSRSSSGSQLARQYRTGSDFAETLELAPPHPISPFFDETDWATALPTLDEAFQVMKNGGSIICPSALGYSVFALAGKEGADAIASVKGRPDGKPLGTCGTEKIFQHTFGRSPPQLQNHFCDDLCVSFAGKPSTGLLDRERLSLVESQAMVGPEGKVFQWINLGPAIDYLAQRAYDELGSYMLVSSGNPAGEGNPTSQDFTLDAVDERVRSAVDYEVDLPHWSTPEFDEEGCWLSAPIFEMDTFSFCRQGKHMKKAKVLVTVFDAMDGKDVMSRSEFKCFLGSLEADKKRKKITDEEEVSSIFNSIVSSGSGDVDFNELYRFLYEGNFNVDVPASGLVAKKSGAHTWLSGAWSRLTR